MQQLRGPLLIGGATTSRTHTAVRIEPRYSGPVVHVIDASRAVGVASALLSDTGRDAFVSGIRHEYAELRARRAERLSEAKRQSIAAARTNKLRIEPLAPPAPTFRGVRTFDEPLADLVPRIDWTPFFQTWELAGHYPAILDDPTVGEAATALYADARAMLRRIVDEHWLTARAVVGFFRAASDGCDDIRVWDGDDLNVPPRAVIHTIRQQMLKSNDEPNLALSDYVAPLGSPLADWIGAFAVTTGIGLDEKVAEFEKAGDDYSAILLKALADRLAEAFAERLHERVRRDLWGYAPDEHLDNHAIIHEDYQGIRPAPGYPACPDHTEKQTLFELLDRTSRRPSAGSRRS